MKDRYKNVVIDVSLADGSLESMLHLKNSPILANAENVHLVSVYNDKLAKYLPCSIVNKEDFNEVEKYARSRMEELKDELKPSDADPARWHVDVVFNNDIKHIAVEFLRNHQADLAVTSTRGHQGINGIFKDSFAFYLVQHAPCDVYVVRPVH